MTRLLRIGSNRLSLIRLILVCLFILLGLGVYGEDDDWYYDKPIRSVTFKGLNNVKPSEVDGITASFIGKAFTDDVFSDLVNRVYSLDLFDDVSPQALPGDDRRRTVAIVFNVKERPMISRLVISGNRQVRNAEIKDAISLKEKDVYVQTKALIDERAIRDLYLGKGFTNVKVSSSTSTNARGIVLTFNIEEGNSTVVTSVAFRGNKVVTDKTLRSKLKLKEAGLFSKGPFQEAMLEQDKQSIALYYQDRGYADANVIDVLRDITSNEEKHRDELTITFVIQEGQQYSFEGITFDGNNIFPSDFLRQLVRIKDGATYNETRFQEGLRSIADLYYENGYTSNEFYPEAQKDVDRRTISYVFHINENPRSHIERIILKGNKKTKDYVILRELPIEPGDIFSKAKVTNGLRNLFNLQYFSAVVPEIMPGSEENLVDLVVSLEEQSTTSIEFGLTFSGVDDPDELPFALFVKWQDSNVGGTGKTIGASTTVATKQQSIGLSYGEGWFMGKPISFSLSADLSHSNITALRNYVDNSGFVDTDDYYMEYEQYRLVLGASLGRRWMPNFAIVSWSGGINTIFKTNVYDDENWVPLDTTVVDYANKWGVQNALWTAVSLDGRDINYDPTRGWFASQRFTWYGISPMETEYYLKTDTKLEKYFTLVNWPVGEHWAFKLVLAGYSGMTMLFPYLDTSLGDTSKLYVDGMFNGRGWTSLYSEGRKARGRILWNSNAEIRFPVVPGILSLDFFFDAAIVNHIRYYKDSSYYEYSGTDTFDTIYKIKTGYWDRMEIQDKPMDVLNNMTLSDFYFSYGPSIRFSIPQFPLRLIFARRFRMVDGEAVYEDGGDFKFVLSFNLVNK